MDEDDAAARGQDEIGIARKIAAVQRVAKAEAMDHAPHGHFGLGVLAVDALHHRTAFGWGEGVHLEPIIS